ncbi:MAG: hypothetical protein Q8O92_04415 [Candidatus Latescibacter sp.]|nr:hypothetical protein [Candidatus Latescibacter sp.]
MTYSARQAGVYLIALVSIYGLIMGCGSKKDEKPAELQFKVNPSLLSEKVTYNEFGFSFSPPKQCLPLSKELTENVLKIIGRELAMSDTSFVKPIQFFVDAEQRIICVVSSLPKLEDRKDQIAGYELAIMKKMGNDKTMQGIFSHGGFVINQMRVITKEMVIFKLFVAQNSHTSFQIDYIITLKFYEKNGEAIESSIGSLTKK